MSRATAVLTGLLAAGIVCALVLVIVLAPSSEERRVDTGAGASPPSEAPPSSTPDAEPGPGTGTASEGPSGPAQPTPTRTKRPRRTPEPPPSAPCAELSDAPELTVLSFNIHGGNGRSGYDLQQVAAEIRAADADVVLLQEVHRFRRASRLADQPAELERLTGMTAVFGANFSRNPEAPGQPRRQSGTALLSRLPILSWSNTPLVNQPGLQQRGLLRATVAVGPSARTVDVYGTHLQHVGATIRPMQARHIGRIVAQRDLPYVIGGDLNAPPGSEAMRIMRSFVADPWNAVGTGAGHTAPQWNPRIRIDYVLHGEGWAPVSARVLPSAVSDHRAVRTTLRLVPAGGC